MNGVDPAYQSLPGGGLAKRLEKRVDAKANKIPIATTVPTGGMEPNVCYQLGTTDSVTVTLAEGEDNVLNIYMFVFTAESASCTVTLPQGVTLANEYEWEMKAGRRFEVTIIDNIAAVIYSD